MVLFLVVDGGVVNVVVVFPVLVVLVDAYFLGDI
jgi:hypothetical protein